MKEGFRSWARPAALWTDRDPQHLTGASSEALFTIV